MGIPLPVYLLGETGRNGPGITSEELHTLLEKARVKHNVPALAAGMVRGGKKPLAVVVGVRKRETDNPATADDQWHLGSNTKPITALLIALLVDLGVLDWDTPLEQIFPEQAEKWDADLKKITPAHLLTHTSGLPSLGPIVPFLLGGGKGPPHQDRERLVKSLATVRLKAKPGEKYEYSNLGYVVLGAVIDRRGKAPWEEQLEKRVFRPLGIKGWGLGPPDGKGPVVQPCPHQVGGKPVAPGGVLDNPPVMNSAGRVRLTVPDYNRFLAEVLRLARGEKGLLRPATARKVFSNPYPVSPHSLSGWLGFRKKAGAGGLVLAHDGSNSLNYCTAAVLPDRNLALCVLTNQGGPDGPGEKVCHEVQKELRGSEKRSAQQQRIYENRLTPIPAPKPLLADHPEFIAPIRDLAHFEAPILVDDEGADLHVRAWRYSYNARGIIEMPNRLQASTTAIIVVHPWGIDDGQGWKTPEPAGVCDFCTPARNALAGRHTRMVINPFLKSLRGKVSLVMYSLIGSEDPIRKKLYRSIHGKPSLEERAQGARELKAKLAGFKYQGGPVPAEITLSKDRPVVDYFRQFPGLDASPRFNNAGFWDLPVPVCKDIEVDSDDVVLYDPQGYPALKRFLEENKIRHVLLAGYAADMCYCQTTAGYKNMSRDFNVFLVGDATLATFPANASPKYATNAAVSFAALDQLVTQVSWVRYQGASGPGSRQSSQTVQPAISRNP
jgi:CubicO group peptidase (beta-lactamase class C family)